MVVLGGGAVSCERSTPVALADPVESLALAPVAFITGVPRP